MSDSLKLGTQYRSLPFKLEGERKADDGSSVLRIAISSEFPVTREFGVEILDHTSDSVDMSRIKDAAPFCIDHNLRDQVGVLEHVSLDSDKVIRADVKFSRSQKAQDIKNDIVDGIRKHISVGYQIRKMVKLNRKSEELDTYRVVNWLPFEASTVAVPADPTVGVGRSLPDNATVVEIVGEEVTDRGLEITTEAVTVDVSTVVTTLNDSGCVVSDKVNGTTSYSVTTEYEVTPPDNSTEEESPAEEATESPEEEIAEELQETVPRSATSIVTVVGTSPELHRMEHINVASPIVLSEKEKREYSFGNAVSAILTGKRSGLEFEISDEIAKNLGRETNGFYMPTNVRAMSSNTANAGQELVFTHEGEFIDLLRAATVALQAGARIVPANQKVAYPRMVSGSSAQWVAEGSNATAADLAFDSVTLDPRLLTAQASFSRKLLQVSSYAVDQYVREAFIADFAVAIDRAALAGAGTNEPTGILSGSGVPSVSGTSGSVATFAMMVEAETLVAQNNGNLQGAVYVITPGLNGKLKQTQVAAGTDSRMILTNGEINGYKALVSNLIPYTTTLNHQAVFGNFRNLAIADGGAIEIIVDNITAALGQNIKVTGQWMADVVILQPKAFSKLTQLRTV